MPGEKPAARVGDPIGHSCAMSGALAGLAVGALIGVAILTGGLGAVAIGAAIAVTGGAGLAGEYIGESIPGPPSGAIATGSPNVMINLRPASAVTIGTAPCAKESGVPQVEASGAATVLINTNPAGRVGETFTCSATILSGSSNVVIGGPSIQVLAVTPEVPVWLNRTMTAMAVGGTLLATGGIWATYGAGMAIGGFFGGLAGGWVGGQGARMAASAMGYGETGQRVAEVIGGVGGGFLGGWGGMRGGGALQARIAGPRPPVATGRPPTGQQTEPFPYSPKKIGQTEPGAVPNNAKLQAEMDAAPLARARSADGYPDLPADKAATFGDDVRPWNGDEHSGPIRRVIGSDRDANGGYWQSEIPANEADWRAGSAVKNDWNGNGGYVESSPKGLKGWIGTARPQMSSDGVNVLPGHGEQIWIPPGSASPGPTTPTPWSGK